MGFYWWTVLVSICFWFGSNALETSQPCVALNLGNDRIVCVCNSTYCDSIGSINQSDNEVGTYISVTSSKSGQRFEHQRKSFLLDNGIKVENESANIEINSDINYQTIFGFGGAFTDSTGLNLLQLSLDTQNNLLKSYFGTYGIEYTIGRVPIGGTDFSTRPYSYDDDHDGDFNLTHWSLQDEDINFKIPIIHRAIAYSSTPVSLFASAWSAPTWMKTSGTFNRSGTLKGDVGGPYYQTWADYYIRFLDAYKAHGLNMWGLTAQNEPLDGFVPEFSFNCMGFNSSMQADFIQFNLGPNLVKFGYGDLKLMILDDQRVNLPGWAEDVLSVSEAAKYVSGIAVHWYTDRFQTPQGLNATHHLFPERFLLATEACEGYLPWDESIVLGDWNRAENYAFDILEDLANWFIGWVDWNLCLDQNGGPNWASNTVDSAIIVNPETDEFYKQPMYYAIGHFSKFVKPGSVRIGVSATGDFPRQADVIAFDGPDGSTVVVILNRSDNVVNVSISDKRIPGNKINEEVPAHAIQTLIWWR